LNPKSKTPAFDKTQVPSLSRGAKQKDQKSKIGSDMRRRRVMQVGGTYVLQGRSELTRVILPPKVIW